MFRSRLGFCIVCLLVLSGSASASPSAAGTPPADESRSAGSLVTLSGSTTTADSAATPAGIALDSLQEVIRSFQDAWMASDAGRLVGHCVDGKVSVALGHGPAGWFSRDQTYYLLGQLFAATQTHDFRFASVRDPPMEQGAAALAHWRHRNRGGGQVSEDFVLVALVRQAERWSVSMIQVFR